MRSSLTGTAARSFGSIERATIEKVDDKTKLQELTVSVLKDERHENVEVFGGYGFKAVPVAPEKGKKAEAVVAFLGGNRAHPVALAIDDRRYRPTDWKPGDSGFYHYKGDVQASARFTDDGFRFNAGSERKPAEWVVGDAKIIVAKDKITIAMGDDISVTIDSEGFHFKGGKVEHDEHKIDKTHKHTNAGGSGLSGAPE